MKEDVAQVLDSNASTASKAAPRSIGQRNCMTLFILLNAGIIVYVHRSLTEAQFGIK